MVIEDRAAVEYHLGNGHIVQWLHSIGEVELALELEGVRNIEKAKITIEKHLEKEMIVQRMKRGRMH